MPLLQDKLWARVLLHVCGMETQVGLASRGPGYGRFCCELFVTLLEVSALFFMVLHGSMYNGVRD